MVEGENHGKQATHKLNLPPVIVVPPLYVFAPARNNVPAPIFVSAVPTTVLPAARVTELLFVSIVPPPVPSVTVRALVERVPPACRMALLLIATPPLAAPSAVSAFAFNVPPTMLVPPPYVFTPVTVSVPAPDFVTLPPRLVRLLAHAPKNSLINSGRYS